MSSLTVTISPTGLVAAGLDNGQRLVQRDLLARTERVEVDLRRDLDVHLATGGDDLRRAVRTGGQERREGGGWPAQVLQPALQLDDLVPGLAESVSQALVLGGERGGVPGRLGGCPALIHLRVLAHDRLRSTS